MSTAQPPATPAPDFKPNSLDQDPLDGDMLTMLEQECEEALPDLLRLFLSECEKRVAQIERAGTTTAQMGREAHTLKGAAISFGCPRLSAAARDLEVAAIRGDAALPPLVRPLIRAYHAARAALLERYPDLRASAVP